MFINANFSGDRLGNNERREQVLLLQGPREPAARTTWDPCPVRGPPPGLRRGVLQTHSVLPLCQVNVTISRLQLSVWHWHLLWSSCHFHPDWIKGCLYTYLSVGNFFLRSWYLKKIYFKPKKVDESLLSYE